ncbi:carboxylating nicotinate-nucleotide diphosphorylase [bacterium]|nr:carboxylating nicotinate-nucleotide diphosphorylase [Akkermansiaceae bacterium]MDB4522325.1 carboxylating nicotinate-nucleotide diphosphorylase [bacterium]MDB4304309.1 carboxylating nicotinate-nucleotide diphosphorylase [Akkermansiaceae bacterium]MDB4320302.1 carboxylating nicotinate-nucleotide diphosphorylase [Akkermansiaceae bacterium]MDB4382204.1 carboxylating nicotinate-nucleotide diphosphorylase [Akkermansiaceae bacterium]
MDQTTSTLIDLALAEDIGSGDVTSEYFVPEDRLASGVIIAKDIGFVAGVEIAAEVFRRVDPDTTVEILLESGNPVTHRTQVLKVSGKARSLLTAERVALNFLQRLSGVATKTNHFVKLTEGTKARILDTRKTTPGWRSLEKGAVLAGGGTNHRIGLYDRAMVKDNHLMAEGGIPAMQDAISRLRKEKPGVAVELEADRLDQVEAFLGLEGVDYILLDNMSLDELRAAVALRKGDTPQLEASGGVNLETVAGIAATGVDFISVGAVTHSAVALDLSLEFLSDES